MAESCLLHLRWWPSTLPIVTNWDGLTSLTASTVQGYTTVDTIHSTFYLMCDHYLLDGKGYTKKKWQIDGDVFPCFCIILLLYSGLQIQSNADKKQFIGKNGRFGEDLSSKLKTIVYWVYFAIYCLIYRKAGMNTMTGNGLIWHHYVTPPWDGPPPQNHGWGILPFHLETFREWKR